MVTKKRVVPHDFIGPLRPGTVRAPAPFVGPIRPGTDPEVFRRTGRSVPIRPGGGGTGVSRKRETFQQRKNREARIRREAQQEARRKLDKALADRQRLKILREQSRLIARGAREKVIQSRNRQGDRLRIVETRLGGTLIRETRNLTTGQTRINRFAPGRAGGGMRRTGGVVLIGGAKLAKKPVTKELPKDFLKITKVNLDKAITDSIKNETRGFDPTIQNTKQFNASINRDLQQGNVTKRILNVADILSGGALTERSINKDQAEHNTRVIKFNDKFGGRELSEAEFKKAQSEQKFIDSEQSRINRRVDSLANSKRDSIRDFFLKLRVQETPRLTVKQQEQVIKARKEDRKLQARIKSNKPAIDKGNKFIKEKEKEIKKLQSKPNRTLFEDIKLIRLKNKNNTIRTNIAIIEGRRPPKIIAGTIAIGGARIPSSISQISFVGAQKVGKGGKIVTDIIFRTKKGTIGFARGVSVIKKGNTISVVAGRFGKVSVKLLTGKRRIRGIRSFVAAEKGISKATKFTSDQLKRIAKFTQKQKKKGVLRIIKSNIRGLQQAGIGRVATVKGKKFFKPFIRFPSGKIGSKLAKGIDLDQFASISAVLTKKQLSLIIGKTITFKGGKAEFIGLIKSLKSGASVGTLTTIQKQQFSKATQKLFSSVAAAVVKAEKTGTATTKALKLAAAAAILSKTKIVTAKVSRRKAALVRTRVRQRVIVTTVKPTITTRSELVISKRRVTVLQKTRRKIKTKQRTLQSQVNKQRQKVRQLTKQRTKQRTKQQQRQLSRAKQIQKQFNKQLTQLKTQQRVVTKQIQITPTVITPPTIIRLLIPPRIKKKKLKGAIIRKKGKKSFDVFAKPVKGRRLIKINQVPLSQTDARGLRNLVIDQSLSRQGEIRTRKGKPKKPKLKVPRGSDKRLSKKFRRFKIRKGKRIPLRRGRVIERRSFISDTKREKQKLTLARRVAQLRKQSKKKTLNGRRKPARKIKAQRKRTAAQLQSLRIRNLKKARIEKARLARIRSRQSRGSRTNLRRKISII